MSQGTGKTKAEEAGPWGYGQPPPAYPSQPGYAGGYDPNAQPTGYSDQTYYPVQQPGGAPVVSQQPMVIVASPGMPLTNPPDDHLCYAIFVTICCCWPIGIFAILKSSSCREAAARGDRSLAEIRSKEARNLSHISLGVGIAMIVLSIVITAIYIGVILSSIDTDY